MRVALLVGAVITSGIALLGAAYCALLVSLYSPDQPDTYRYKVDGGTITMAVVLEVLAIMIAAFCWARFVRLGRTSHST